MKFHNIKLLLYCMIYNHNTQLRCNTQLSCKLFFLNSTIHFLSLNFLYFLEPLNIHTLYFKIALYFKIFFLWLTLNFDCLNFSFYFRCELYIALFVKIILAYKQIFLSED